MFEPEGLLLSAFRPQSCGVVCSNIFVSLVGARLMAKCTSTSLV